MKNIIAIILAMLATTAFGLDIETPRGTRIHAWPTILETTWGQISPATPEECMKAGYRLVPQETLDREAVEAAESVAALLAAAEAQRAEIAKKEAAIAEAVSFATEKSKKEAAAQLEAIDASAGGKEPAPEEKLALLWKWKQAELQKSKEKNEN